MKGYLSEKQIENQILSWLKVNEIFAFKVKTVGTYDEKLGKFRRPSIWYRKGTSDILGIYRNKFLAIEVKSEKGRTSPFQDLFLHDVKEHGGIAFVAKSVEDVEYQLKLEDERGT